MRRDIYPVRILLSLLFDYFRWTQMVPMILLWSMLAAMSFVLLFAYNEDAAWSLLELGVKTVQSLPVIGDRFTQWMESQTVDGVFSPDLGTIDYKALALNAWALLSLAFMLTGAVLSRLLGPLPSFTLKHKLALAAAASTVVIVAFAILYFIDREGWGAGFFQMLGSASGMGLVLFVISAWCLTISHALAWLSRAVMDPEFISIRTDPSY